MILPPLTALFRARLVEIYKHFEEISKLFIIQLFVEIFDQ